MRVFHVSCCVVRCWCLFWWVIISTVLIRLLRMFNSDTFADCPRSSIPDIDHRRIVALTQHRAALQNWCLYMSKKTSESYVTIQELSLNGSSKDSRAFISAWIFLSTFETKIASRSIISSFTFSFIYNLCKGENPKHSTFISTNGTPLHLHIRPGLPYILLCIYAYCAAYCVKNADKRCERVVVSAYVKAITHMNSYLFINYSAAPRSGTDEEISMAFGIFRQPRPEEWIQTMKIRQ